MLSSSPQSIRPQATTSLVATSDQNAGLPDTRWRDEMVEILGERVEKHEKRYKKGLWGHQTCTIFFILS